MFFAGTAVCTRRLEDNVRQSAFSTIWVLGTKHLAASVFICWAIMEAHARFSMVLGNPMQGFVHVRQASTLPTKLQLQELVFNNTGSKEKGSGDSQKGTC